MRQRPLKVIVNGKQLNQGVDYTIHYEDGEDNETMQVREPGNYKLVVEGQKNYQGNRKTVLQGHERQTAGAYECLFCERPDLQWTAVDTGDPQ